ncbi:uncharacterized protein EI97DRAFT_466362 [Westerdykella ornata]|uniref:Uncharacterized protein n=1 Tax=Westerdykella ornata TaxID=318751 RepID=A0A6A6JLY7_WESOR|nr:uncharacterized protein EI97DRAFT_466362 [Westerdykella ornata]KAF2277517.1 hypothetical protein EI97DRAFT_466362 [Westerdykella ornata]
MGQGVDGDSRWRAQACTRGRGRRSTESAWPWGRASEGDGGFSRRGELLWMTAATGVPCINQRRASQHGGDKMWAVVESWETKAKKGRRTEEWCGRNGELGGEKSMGQPPFVIGARSDAQRQATKQQRERKEGLVAALRHARGKSWPRPVGTPWSPVAYLIYSHVFSLPDPRGDRALRLERRHIKHLACVSPATVLLLLHHEPLLLNRQIAAEALETLFKRHTVFLSCGPWVLRTFLQRVEQHRGSGGIGNDDGNTEEGRKWLRWLKKIELDWVTFPNMRNYPPEREPSSGGNAALETDEWWWERDGQDIDLQYVSGYEGDMESERRRERERERARKGWGRRVQYQRGHSQGSQGNQGYEGYSYDEYDHEGSAYNDNFYGAEDDTLYPSFPPLEIRRRRAQHYVPAVEDDPFGFGSHYPFALPTQPANDTNNDDDDENSDGQVLDPQDDVSTKLNLLIDLEVVPLFTYLSTPTVFPALQSISLPLFFISKRAFQRRTDARGPGYALPLKLRYWVKVLVEAVTMLVASSSSDATPEENKKRNGDGEGKGKEEGPRLEEVLIKYRPWDIWASMDPSDDLAQMVEKGIWFRDDSGGDNGEQADQEGGDAPRRGSWEGEGESFRAVWHALSQRGVDVYRGGWDGGRLLDASMRYVRWDGDLGYRVGDELEVVLTRRG